MKKNLVRAGMVAAVAIGAFLFVPFSRRGKLGHKAKRSHVQHNRPHYRPEGFRPRVGAIPSHHMHHSHS